MCGEDGCVTPVEQCSVENRAALIDFRAKRLEWLSWLNTDEHHAIWKQITAMAWNDAAFRVLNEARNPTNGHQVSATNGMLGGFIDQGYVSTQVLAIRRLVEVPKSRRNRPADIISLPRLLGDIRAYRPNITREIFVSYDGLPYEWEAVRDKWYAENPISGEGSGYLRLPATGADAFDMARRQHETFDWLSDTPAKQRNRKDLISEWVFDRLDAALNNESITQIVALSHKFLAHAADGPSRSAASLQEFGLTLEMVASAHKAITLVAQAVSVLLVDGSSHLGIVPTAQFNQFAGLEQPYVSSGGIPHLRKIWHAHTLAREEWCGQWRSVFREQTAEDINE
jgi:hypothetical protein